MGGGQPRGRGLVADDAADHGTGHEAWTQGVAVDTVPGVVDGNGLCQADDGVLRGHVRGRVGGADDAEHRGRVDDPAARGVAAIVGRVRRLHEELLQGVLAAEEDAACVDGERLVEDGHVRIVDAAGLVPVFGLDGDACAAMGRSDQYVGHARGRQTALPVAYRHC